VKAVHTLVWAVFAGCIVAIPALAALGHLRAAAWLIGVVFVEVVVLVFNGMRCPLTDVAARYTSDRHANFDIHLPLWLAQHNKTIFGALYVIGIGYTTWAWLSRA
jgi:hypothetical protein